jgi:preprotein translocase subunit SecF
MQQLRKRAERYQASHARGARDVEAGHGPPDEGTGTRKDRPQDAVAAARAAGTPRASTGRPVHPYAQPGPRNQPRRPPKSKR